MIVLKIPIPNELYETTLTIWNNHRNKYECTFIYNISIFMIVHISRNKHGLIVKTS